jgi:PAS domain S-box-containing protein
MDDEKKPNEQLIAGAADLSGQIKTVAATQNSNDDKTRDVSVTRLRLEHLLAASPAVIYSTDIAGDFSCTFVSENLKEIMGYAPEEMTTDMKHWRDRLHPDDASRVIAEIEPLIQRGGGSVEYRFRHRDGHYVWIQDTFTVIYDGVGTQGEEWPRNDARVTELVGAWADITKRKEAEQAVLKASAALQETKRSLARLIESSPDAIISTDKGGSIVLFNEGAEVLLGYRAEEVIGKSVNLLYGGEAGANQVLREMRKRGGTVASLDSVLWTKDGMSIPVLISASVLFDDDGQEVGTVGFATDLRERKKAQEELQRSYDELEKHVEERTTELKEARARLQYLLTVTPGIIYTNQGSGNYKCTFVSQNVDPVMGFSEWEMLEDPEFWPNRLHPDDAHRVFEEMGPLVESGGGSVEYRFRHRDGQYVWIQDTFKVVKDEAGRPVELVGSWADITHRKQVENALGERMALMNDLQNLVAASPAVIYTTQASGDFACTFVSENLKTTMGYAPWEMKRLHPEDAGRVLEGISTLITRGGGTIEYRFRHRRGNYIWLQDTFKVTEGKNGKELVGSWADITERKAIEAEVQRLMKEVELRNRFIRDTFGRYLTDEVVNTLLDSPTGLQMGGEKRNVTMLMADLRGFTSLSERLAPKWVVTILNRYFEAMVRIVKKYDGTIDEFIGDAVFVLFGAPNWREDDAARAVACAIEMQLAMAAVNEKNRLDDLPEIHMGIGIHSGQVVVGNIGSTERMKYGVVGSHVNLTSRIQSYTVADQILVSETTRRDAGTILKIGKQMEVRAKGFEHPVTLSEVVGIGGPYKLAIYQTRDELVPIADDLCFKYSLIEGEHLRAEQHSGRFVRLSPKQGEAILEGSLRTMSNVEIVLADAEGKIVAGALYAKITGHEAGSGLSTMHFTSMSPEVEALLREQLIRTSAPAARSNAVPQPTTATIAASLSGSAQSDGPALCAPPTNSPASISAYPPVSLR